MKNMIATEPGVAELFGKKNGKYKIWQETNNPEIIETEKFGLQKLNYLHQNPVRKKYVQSPESWYFFC